MMKDWITKTSFTPDEILEVLPHRYPFLLVDRVIELKTGKPLRSGMTEAELNEARKGSTVHAIKNVTFNEAQFQGHFPGKPILPGVLTLEAMAQSAAFVAVPFVAAANGGELKDLKIALAGFDGVRFRMPIVPGDRMDLHVKLEAFKRNVWNFAGEVRVDGKVAAEGSFLAQLFW